MKKPIYPLKQLLSGGLLCLAVLIAAYLFETFFSGMYVNAFSSSMYTLFWMTLLVGALYWTFREQGTDGLGTQIIDWQLVAAFFLFIADQVFLILPRGVQEAMTPALSTYTLPILVIGGIAVVAFLKFSILLYRKLEEQRKLTAVQTQRIQELLASPPSTKTDGFYIDKILHNQSICQISASEYLQLVEECQTIDPILFDWLKKQSFERTPQPRDIIFCILIRLHKTKRETLDILKITEKNYRVTKSRVRGRLNIEGDLEEFLKALK